MSLSKEREQTHWFKKIEQLHPYRMLIYLGMFSSGLVFFFLATAFLISQSASNSLVQYQMPKSFIISSFMIIGSAFISAQIIPAFLEQNLKKTKRKLTYTLVLGILFTIFQFRGWQELAASGIDFTGLPSGSSLYILSRIHLSHLAGAMIYALNLWLLLQNSEKDLVKSLVILTNPYEKMRLELFSLYWKFMDIVWLILFGLFLWVF